MKAEDIIRGRIREALNEQKERLLRSLRKLDIWERADIEPFIDEMQKQAWQAQLKQKSWLNLEENYSKHELGLRRVLEVDTCSDKGGDEYQINKAIQKAAAVSDKISGKKPRTARKLLETFASAGYYGYLVLRKKLGIPCEHPVLRPWYAKFLSYIPQLINPGGLIMLREGTMTITSSIDVRGVSNIKIQGMGHGTIITFDPDNYTPSVEGTNILYMFYVGGTSSDLKSENIIISDLQIDALDPGLGPDGILGIGLENRVSDKSFYSNIYIPRASYQGFGFGQGSQRVFVYQSAVKDSYHYNLVNYPNNYGAIIGCTFSGGGKAIRANSVGVIVADCVFYDKDDESITYTGGRGYIIANNLAKDYYSYFIMLSDYLSDVVIANNVAIDQKYYRLTCIGITANRLIMVNNKIFQVDRGLVNNPFIIETRDSIIANNVIRGALQEGVKIYRCSRSLFINNVVLNAGQDADNTYDAVLVKDDGETFSTKNIFLNNYIYSDATNKPRYGIAENASGDDYNIYIGNYIEGVGTAAMNILGPNSLARNNFGFASLKTVIANYTMTWADETILADASGGAITVTLPDPASYPNYEIMIKKIDSSTNAVTVTPHGTETIDGASSLTLSSQNDAKRLRSDGSNWYSF